MLKKTVVALAALVLIGCAEPEEDPSVERVAVQLVAPDAGVSVDIKAELAVNEEQRAKGLMFRKHLRDGYGMLFIWSEADIRRMWMKNTLISLDMIFIHDQQIVGLVENAVPKSLAILGPDRLADKVLEVPAGTIAEHGIDKDWEVRIDLPAPNMPEEPFLESPDATEAASEQNSEGFRSI